MMTSQARIAAGAVGAAGIPTKTILLCGVGGQGTILAADLLAHTLKKAGYDVKLSEIHGMAQRGGSVVTVVRYGSKVASMVADVGEADYLLAFETTEALRCRHYLREGGKFLVNDEAIMPLPVLTGQAKMPTQARTRLLAEDALLIPANRLAEEAGTVRAANVVLLGALAAELDIDRSLWEEQIRSRVPVKTIEVNLSAFEAGCACGGEAA